MRISEARWISKTLLGLPPAEVSPLVNVGSSTGEFREVRQPHIDREVFAPLRAAKIQIVHADLKSAPGVDVAGDLMDEGVQATLRARGCRTVLSSNLLEHVRDPRAFAGAMRALVPKGGYLVVTVPRSYPFHADPIDTGFRPTPDEIAELFPKVELVRGEIVEDTTYARELIDQGPRKAVKKLLGALRPRGDAGRAQRDRLRWIARPFTTSCVVLRAT